MKAPSFLNRFSNTQAYRQLIATTRSKKFTAAFGMQKNEKAFALSEMGGFTVVVTTDYVDAQQLVRDLTALQKNFKFFPHKEDVLLFRSDFWQENARRRNSLLFDMLHQKLDGIVLCAEALLQKLPSKADFEKCCFTLKANDEIAFSKLSSQLVANGFTRVEAVEGVGQFSIRGDIVDIVSTNGRFRLDFWGDQIENISRVNDDLSGAKKVSQLSIFPLWDTVGGNQNLIENLKQEIAKSSASQNARTRLFDIVSDIEKHNFDNAWLNPFLQTSTLADFLPQDALIVWDEPKQLFDRVNFLYNENDNRIAELLNVGEIFPSHDKALIDRFKLRSHFKGFFQLAFSAVDFGLEIFAAEEILKFNSSVVGSYKNNFSALKKDLTNWQISGYQVALLCAKTEDLTRVTRQLQDNEIYVSTDDVFRPNASLGLLTALPINHGFVSHTNRLVVIGVNELFGRSSDDTISKSKKTAFLSVEKGDFVVHEFHGIGLCDGIENIEHGGEKKDYIVVLYKGGDKLFVPVENCGLLSRFSGGQNPELNRLGGKDFSKVKSKAREGIKKMSIDLLELYEKRQRQRGHRYRVDSYLLEEFADAFPFSETDDQLQCIDEITSDLSSGKIMDRLLVGDVGFGKTEVAMRAAFAVVTNGFQVAVLVPTTILSEQHFENFKVRMESFDLKVAALNRFKSPSEQKEILKAVASGEIDILIGTHRILSRDVNFKKLGLLILDEEQRFGVLHKEHIKDLKTNVDVLTLTATPIPRTLHMSLSGIRDISTITTPPKKRLAVQTFVTEETPQLLRDVITRELGRGGQVFLLYNSVETIFSFSRVVSELVPEAKIAVAHGQMENLEDAVLGFKQGKTNVLISTTIIENGIDIPNANTLIVLNADKFGLSQLYQLRGRVGRSDRLAYAYFLYNSGKIMTTDAYKRLSSITEYSELGSGFKVALRDLEIRGAGNLLGREQHGHMMKVGYDLYARMLEEAVCEAKGEKFVEKLDCQVESDISAFAPENYIKSTAERLEFYQTLASQKTLPDISRMKKQVEEVYGGMPKETRLLFKISEVKILATAVGVKKITLKRGNAVLEFAEKENLLTERVFAAVNAFGKYAKFDAVLPQIVISTPDFFSSDRLLSAVNGFFEKILH